MKQIGTLTIGANVTEQEHYEFAAWFRNHELQPGTYPVWASKQDHCAYAQIPSTITSAYLGSQFGGVAYGQDTAGKAEIGKSTNYHLSLWRGFDDKRTEWVLGSQVTA